MSTEDIEYCEYCEKETTDCLQLYRGAKHYICEECHNKYWCECGQKLEDSYGQPGDGFCIKCR